VLTIPGCFAMGYVVALVMRAIGIHA
jgi:hypothetical protein